MIYFFKKYGKSTFSSLKVRNYRLYFIGQAISLSGSWMQTVALDWLVLKLTGSGTQLGIVAAFQYLPMLIFGPIGGVIVDYYDKRKILFLTQIFSGILALILGTLTATGTIQIWMVYLLALGTGLVNLINAPTIQTFVFEMVGKDKLSNAITLNSTEVNLARAIGPAIGGGIIAAVGLAPCFFVNAATYLAVLVVLGLMRKEELFKFPALKVRGKLIEGFNYVKQTPILRSIILMIIIIGMFTYEFSVILPLLAQSTFHGGAGTYALMYAIFSTGSAIGGLLAASRKRASSRILLISAFCLGIFLLATSIMPNLPLALAALFFSGIFSINFLTLCNTTLQINSRPEMRGRVMSIWNMGFFGSTPIGAPAIGYIAEHASPRWGLAVGGFAAVFASILGASTLLNKFRIRYISKTISILTKESLDEEGSIPK